MAKKREERQEQRPDARERREGSGQDDSLDRDWPGKTPGSAESGGIDSPVREDPGKTPGNAEG